MDHVYFMAFGSPNQWDGTYTKPPFFGDYQYNFGIVTDPNGLSSIDAAVMLSYDAMLALVHGSQQVLSAHNTINASYLTEALKQITVANPVQGVTGHIAFDSYGDQDPSKMIFVEHIERIHLVIDEQHGCLLKDSCSS
jgi:ABC-type branched-subunit amino acid transport system substrate-binding protein